MVRPSVVHFRRTTSSAPRNSASSSSFRVEKLLSIGTTKAELPKATYDDIATTLKKHDVTEVCGNAVDAALDFKKAKAALTDLSVDQRQALKSALDKRERDAPSILDDLFKIPPTPCSNPAATSRNGRRPSAWFYTRLSSP